MSAPSLRPSVLPLVADELGHAESTRAASTTRRRRPPSPKRLRRKKDENGKLELGRTEKDRGEVQVSRSNVAEQSSLTGEGSKSPFEISTEDASIDDAPIATIKRKRSTSPLPRKETIKAIDEECRRVGVDPTDAKVRHSVSSSLHTTRAKFTIGDESDKKTKASAEEGDEAMAEEVAGEQFDLRTFLQCQQTEDDHDFENLLVEGLLSLRVPRGAEKVGL
ncbi:hypothetical protein CC80DRAFT_592072 [Byssothecium circinans]|uniref:Uncharacterized protein n=1 Tax=Byssothecium circinans TaxID=147558 RepID=A0A6A5U163_9PLEO|nr:hypothetical protein CC80DRAFT_592072 [Byssothecium circinans]